MPLLRRPVGRRRSDSARQYLNTENTSPALLKTVSLLAKTLGFPVAHVNIIDEDQQYTLINYGGHPSPMRPRAESACAEVVDNERAAFITSTLLDASDHQIGLIARSPFKTYASIPLRGREGLVVGSVCVLDFRRRPIAPDDIDTLADFASIIEEQLDLQRRAGVDSGFVQTDTDLPDALAAGQIVPWYQPVVELDTNEVSAYEALARWEHPTKGLIAPDSFVPVAEESDLIIDLDLAMLSRAAADLVLMRRMNQNLKMSVNVSGRHLAHPDCVRQIRRAIEMVHLTAADVTLELTETSMVSAGPESRRNVEQLHELGFRIVLDDFGTGWSSFERLLQLRVDGLKIDRRISGAMDTEAGAAMVRAISAMAKELGLSLVIEGIETQEQADLAIELGCTHGQGYLWSQAVPARDLVPGLRLCAIYPGP